jgi:hypothetical protein
MPTINLAGILVTRRCFIALVNFNGADAKAGISANPDWKYDDTGFIVKKRKLITVARIGNHVYRKIFAISMLFAEQ